MPSNEQKTNETNLPGPAQSSGNNLTSNLVSLQVHVQNATQIRGTKGEKTSSFVRVQFADFDTNDSPIMNEMVNPNYDYKYNLDLTLTDSLLDTFLNSNLAISVYEVLPKDKNMVLATAEVQLAPYFLSFTTDLASNDPEALSKLNLSGIVTTNLNYSNTKLLSSSMDGKEASFTSTLTIAVSVNRTLMPQVELDQSNIIEFLPLEFSPFPEDWGSKELNEKDPNAAQAQYVLHLSIPMDVNADRSILIPNGSIQVNSAETGAPKKLVWSKGYKAFFSAESLKRLRESIMSNTPLEGEVVKLPAGKPVNTTEIMNSKHRTKFLLDMAKMMLPEVLKGHIISEVNFQDSDEKEGTGLQNKHRLLSRPAANIRFEFEIKFKRPLISQKRLSRTAHTLFDFIPRLTISKEELYSKRVALAESKYREVLDTIVSSFSGMYNSDRGKFLQHVQDAGIYAHAKSAMKPAVIRLIKEKFPAFYHCDISTTLSEIYVYLTDLLNDQVSQHFCAVTLDPPMEDRLLQLKLESEERESLRDWVSAKQLLLARVCLSPDDLLLHLDLAQCHGRCGERDSALELLKTILGRNPKHLAALLTISILTTEPQLTETCLLNLLKFDPKHPTALALLSLHYDMVNQAEKADGCVAEATQQHSSEVFLDAAEVAVNSGATRFAEMAFGQHALVHGSTIRGNLLRAKLHHQLNDFNVALSCLEAAQRIRLDHPQVCAEMGHLNFSFGQFEEARNKYETLLAYHPNLEDHKVFSRLAIIYFKESIADAWDLLSDCKDKEKMKIAQQLFTQSKDWAWVGLTCLLLKQMDESEAALCHVTTTHPRKPSGWIALSVFHLSQEHIFEAEQCANYSLTLGLRNVELLRTAANAFHMRQQDKTAVECLRRAIGIDSKDTRLQVLFEKIIAPKSEPALPTEPVSFKT